MGLAQSLDENIEGGHVRGDAVSNHSGVKRFDEFEFVGFDEEVEGDVVEVSVGF